MAKRKRAQGPKLRRQCGAMAAHMLLLEQFPAFRANQMRLEGATGRRRATEVDLCCGNRQDQDGCQRGVERTRRTFRMRRSTARSR